MMADALCRIAFHTESELNARLFTLFPERPVQLLAFRRFYICSITIDPAIMPFWKQKRRFKAAFVQYSTLNE
jgi:hypothetical protein